MTEQNQGQVVVPQESPFYRTLAAMKHDVDALTGQLNAALAAIYHATEQAKQAEHQLTMAKASYQGVLRQELERQAVEHQEQEAGEKMVAEAIAKAKAEAERAKAKK